MRLCVHANVCGSSVGMHRCAHEYESVCAYMQFDCHVCMHTHIYVCEGVVYYCTCGCIVT